MNKKLAAALLALALLSGCTKQEQSSKKGAVVTTTGRPSSSQTQAEDAPSSIDRNLQQMMEDFSNPFCKLTAETPETLDNTSVQVRADEALGARIASLLTQSPYEANVEKPMGDPSQQARVLTVEARDGKRYSRATLFGFIQNHPFYSGKMMAVIENDTGTTQRYLYDASIFEEIDREMSARVGGVAVQFVGDNVRMRSKYDLAAIKKERGLWAGEFLQLSDAILWRFAAGDPTQESAQVELLNAADGAVLQSYSVPEPVHRMEKYVGPEGGDYRLFTPTRVLFRDSANPSWKQEWVVPSSVKLFTASAQLTGGYDLRFGKFAYAAEDGVYVAAENGAGERLLLAHRALDTVMAKQEGSGWYFNDPRFLLEGERIVCSIVNAQSGGVPMGFAVSDLNTFETTYFTDVRAADARAVDYIDDRVVSVREAGRITLIDSETVEKGALALPWESEEGGAVACFSDDLKRFVVYERAPTIQNHPTSAALYLCSADALDSRDTKLLSITGDIYYPIAITENYLIGYCEDSQGIHYTAMQYDKRKKATGSSVERQPQTASSTAPAANSAPAPTQSSASDRTASSGTSSASTSEWEDQIAGLPPDIAPDWMKDLLLQSAVNAGGGALDDLAPYLGSGSSEDDFMNPNESWFD